ncbi:MAG: COX15/CtaA family protein [Aquificota bacterium]|nr:COX15/CtaA family protein [Aquificota bacterium]MDQ7082875.1 COX15/CtaA family protein [Aquificota bacterium]
MTVALLLITLALTYILMVFGGVVTSTGSGLGCPDWPLCHGQLLPFQIREEFPTPPAPAVVETELQPWIEQTHRILGALTGVFMVASLVSVWRNYRGFPRKGMVWIFLLLVLEALLGMRVVVTEAPLLREFLHYVYTSSHLILSVVILSGLVFVLASVKGIRAESGVPFAEALYLIVMFQVLVGILVRYVKAPDFNQFAYFLHIFLAMGLIILTLYLILRSPGFYSYTTFGLVTLQAVAGAWTVLSKMFLPVLFVHIAVGFLIVAWVSYLVAPKVVGDRT